MSHVTLTQPYHSVSLLVTRVQLLLNATSRWDAKGKIIGVVGICQDISARKEAERKLALVAEDLRQLIDNANAPIFGINSRGEVNEWNKMAAMLLGYSKAEVTGRPVGLQTGAPCPAPIKS